MFPDSFWRVATPLGWIAALLLVLLHPAQAQFANWRAYTDGSSTRSVALEGQRVWVGTQGGLTAVEGNGTTTFFNRANSGLPSDAVVQVAVDGNGVKWLATPAGLTRFDGTTWTVYDRSNSPLTDNNILAVAVDPQNRVWISGQLNGNFGVARFDGTTWTVFHAGNATPALDEGLVTTIRAGVGGTMWFGTYANQFGAGGHLIRFDGTSWQAYHHTNSGLPQADIMQVTSDGSNQVWIATASHGLVLFNGSTWRQYHAGNSGLLTNHIMHVEVGANGKAWIGTPRGLYTYDGSTWTLYHRLNSGLTSNIVAEVVLDAAGNPYVGTSPGVVTPGGLYHFDGSTWRHFNTSNSDLRSASRIEGIAVDRSNALWLATEPGLGARGGLLRLNGNTWTVYTTQNSQLPNDNVGTVELSPDGSLWVGTGYDRTSPSAPYRGGLVHINGSTWTVYHVEENGMPRGAVRSIAFEGAGTRWLGTSYGVVRFDQNGFTHLHNGNSGLPYDLVSDIAVDGQGTKWVATYGGGLARFDGTTWQVFNKQNSPLPDDDLTSVLAATDGSIWASSHAGLARLRNGAWTVYTANSGLPSSNIRTVRQAPNGNIWVGAEDAGPAVFDGTIWRTFNHINAPLTDTSIPSFAFHGNTVWMGNGSLYAYDATVTSVRGQRVSEATAGLLYPNPTTGLVTLRSGAGPYAWAEVFNSLGQLVRTARIHGTSLDLTALPVGLYKVRLHGPDGSTATKLLVR